MRSAGWWPAGEMLRSQFTPVATSPRRRPITYELDHDTLARVFDFEDAGLELVAIYHSHPRGPETPSPTDIAHAYYSESVYLIVSLATPDWPVVRGFRITNEGVREIAVTREDQGDVKGLLPGCVKPLFDTSKHLAYTAQESDSLVQGMSQCPRCLTGQHARPLASNALSSSAMP